MNALSQRRVAAHVVSHPIVVLLGGDTQEGPARAVGELARVHPHERALRGEGAAGVFGEHAELVCGLIGEISQCAAERLGGGRADFRGALGDHDAGDVLDIDVTVRLRAAAVRGITGRDAVDAEAELRLGETSDVDARGPVVAANRVALRETHTG